MSNTESSHIAHRRMDDNVSMSSSSSSNSFSTTRPSFTPPPAILRTRTVSQITRWASKRLSRSSFTGLTDETELSERNLNNLNLATIMGTDNSSMTNGSFSSAQPLLPTSPIRASRVFNTIEEDSESSPEHTPEKAQDTRIRDSYAAFCEQFTMSGPQTPIRKFDLSMGMGETHTDHLADPQSQSKLDMINLPSNDQMETVSDEQQIEIENDTLNMNVKDRAMSFESISLRGDDTPSIIQPRPPPQIMTPLVYWNLQREALERKLARREKVLGRLRSLFSKGQPFRGHRVKMET